MTWLLSQRMAEEQSTACIFRKICLTFSVVPKNQNAAFQPCRLQLSDTFPALLAEDLPKQSPKRKEQEKNVALLTSLLKQNNGIG